MKRLGLLWPVWLVILLLAWSTSATAQTVVDDRVEIDFPTGIIFHLEIENDTTIDSIELEYGAVRASCATAVSKVWPDFEPDSTVDLSWTWDLRRSGSIPPSTPLWWRWRVTDENGQEIETERQEIIFDDPRYEWQETRSEEMILLSAVVDPGLNQTLWETANAALDQLETEIGNRPQELVRIYNYPTTEELRQAILYTQAWTGGLAFTDYNTLLLGINEQNFEWGQRAMAHELTHLIVHQATSNCYGELPSWLDEGLATHMENEFSDDRRLAFETAVDNDDLFPLRTLVGSFPTAGDEANLAYAQSNRVVTYLLETHGPEKMADLLQAFREGQRDDEALQTVYNLNTESLDNSWRESLGLESRSFEPTAVPTPIPTIPPVNASPPAITPTTQAIAAVEPTPTLTPRPPPPPPTDAPSSAPTVAPPVSSAISPSIIIPGLGIALLVVIVVGLGGVVWFFRRR